MDYPPYLDTRFTVRGNLRCDGVGGMLLAESNEGQRLAVRWFPPHAGGEVALEALGLLPAQPSVPRVAGAGLEVSCAWAAVDFPDGALLDISKPLEPQRVAE